MFPIYEWPERKTQSIQPLLILSSHQNPYSSIESLFILSFINSKSHRILISSRHDYSPRNLLPVLVTSDGRILSGESLVEHVLEVNSLLNENFNKPSDYLAWSSLLFKVILVLMDIKSRSKSESDFKIYKKEYSWPLNLFVYRNHQKRLTSFLSTHLVNTSIQELMEECVQVILNFSILLGDADYFGGNSVNLLDAYAWATFYYLSTTDLPLDSPLKKAWNESENLIHFVERYKKEFISTNHEKDLLSRM